MSFILVAIVIQTLVAYITETSVAPVELTAAEAENVVGTACWELRGHILWPIDFSKRTLYTAPLIKAWIHSQILPIK